MIYSGTRNGTDYGFYLRKEGLIDFVEITNEEHHALLEGQSNGKIIKFHKGEKPTLEDPPEPDESEKAEREISKLKNYLSETDYIVIKIMEGAATREHYQDALKKRSETREEIKRLEKLLKK